MDEDIYWTTEELGIDISRPERGSDEEDARREAERRSREFGNERPAYTARRELS